MIVSASRRTDIPALYSEWLLARLAAGEVEVANPFRPAQTRRVDLRPTPEGTMEGLVLWTRNPSPLLPHVAAWDRNGIHSLWLVTLTGYPPPVEPAAPTAATAVGAVRHLAKVVGPQRIAWRYDPVLLAPESGLDENFHRTNFRRLATQVAPWVGRCIVSAFDDYAKTRKRLAAAGVSPAGKERTRSLLVELSTIAEDVGLPLQCCAEAELPAGAAPGACIDPALLSDLWDLSLSSRADPGQRSGCHCAPAVDIGVYDTCTHGCLYCYATGSPRRVAARNAAHRADQPRLA